MVQMFELWKKTPAAVLRFFIENPSRELYLKEIQRETKTSKASLIYWLNKFVEAGILSKKVRGRLSIYCLRRDDPFVKHLRILMNVGALLPLARELGELGAEVYLYGSAARGEDVEGSDVDLLILGKADPREVSRHVQAFSGKAGRAVRPQIFSKFEWSQMAKKDVSFFERVERDKIRLV